MQRPATRPVRPHVIHLASRSRIPKRLAGACVAIAAFAVPWLHGANSGELWVRGGDLALHITPDGRIDAVRVRDRLLPAGNLTGGLFLADVTGIAGASPRRLDINGDFENVPNGRPRGWAVGNDWTVDRNEHHSGLASMQVNVPDAKPRSSDELGTIVPAVPNALYRASLWMKTRGCAPHFYIVFLDADGRTHRGWPQLVVSHNRRNRDWFRLERTFATPPFCTRIRLYVRLWKQNGTAWVDDVALERLDHDLVRPQRPVSGTVRRQGSRVLVETAWAEQGLRLRTTYAPRSGYIEASGKIEDLTGKDRAVTASFRLPVAVAGWMWFDDLRSSQQVRPGILYGAARPFGEGRLIGTWPFAAVADDSSGLAMAVRMDDPSVFRLCARTDRGVYASYEFGLTRATSKFPGKAHWRCVIFPCDPKWGLRSAAEHYYRFFPRFFRKRLQTEGGAGFMPDRKRLFSTGRPWNPPAFAIYNWHNRDAVAGLRLEGVRLFSYTEFSGWWGWALGVTPDKAAQRPTPEAAWEHVRKLAHAQPPHRVAQCILNCNPETRDGRPYLHPVYVPKWGGYNYVCNPDPDIEGLGGRLNRFTLTLEREVSKVRTFHLDGMYYDCVFVFETDNFRREHFRWADHPPAFDHVTGRPVLPLAFSIYECAETISRDMHQHGKLVMANYSVTNQPVDVFCMQFVDIVGNEMLWTTPNEPKLMLERALAGKKTLSMSWQEAKNDWPADRIEKDMKRAMAWGAFYYLSGMDPVLYHTGLRLTQGLADAGWEPVTRAVVSPDSCVLERFGALSRRNLQFTLHNPDSTPASCRISFEAATLGLAAAHPAPLLWVRSGPFEYRPVPLQHGDAVWTARIPVEPDDTLVLRVGTPADRALDQLLIIGQAAERATAFADALRKTDTSIPTLDGRELRQLAEDVRRFILADRPRRAAAVFDRMAAAVPAPDAVKIAPGTSASPVLTPRTWRLRRLRFYLDELRSAIHCARTALSEE